jgi:Arc/MetJ family transcription regulator
MRIYGGADAYTLDMIKRTSINLDLDLVAEARKALGTKTATDTVHTALRDVVRHERLKRVAELRFDHMPDEWWDELEREEDSPADDS